MRRLLVINPNTSTSVTALLQQHVAAAVGDQAHVRCVTAAFGAPYISDETSYAIGAHAAIDAWTTARQEPAGAPDAVIIGCFGDPGLFALREASAAPVTGLAEASFRQATAHGGFAVVTGGARWVPMLQRLALALGYGDALRAVHAVAPTGGELAADPAGARTLLAQACRDAAVPGTAAIVLGGAGLAGMAADIQVSVDVPVIDSVQAGAQEALRLLSNR